MVNTGTVVIIGTVLWWSWTTCAQWTSLAQWTLSSQCFGCHGHHWHSVWWPWSTLAQWSSLAQCFGGHGQNWHSGHHWHSVLVAMVNIGTVVIIGRVLWWLWSTLTQWSSLAQCFGRHGQHWHSGHHWHSVLVAMINIRTSRHNIPVKQIMFCRLLSHASPPCLSVSYHHVINHIPKMPLPHAKGTISWTHHLKWHHFHATPHIPLVGNKLHHMGAWCLFYKQEVMSCRGSTKAQSQDACFSWTSDTGKWTLTWYVPAPLCLNPWKCLNPFLGDPIRVRTTFLTTFYNKTGTIMPSFLNVFNPLFSGPISQGHFSDQILQ